MAKTKVASRKVTYTVAYTTVYCVDIDSPSGIGDHQLHWDRNGKEVSAKNDREAQLASLSPEFRRTVGCHCSSARGSVVGIIKKVFERTADGFERTTETNVPLPKNERCPCGKRYWPVKGERPCHQLLEAEHVGN